MNSKNNFLENGNSEKLRVKTLNKIYNPFTKEFLVNNGLKKGMTILEFSSRIGFFAIELAEFVGNKGKVIAIFNDMDSLKITKKMAHDAGILNIEFKLCDIENIANLNIKFDFAYGRWVLIYNNNLENAIKKLQDSLKPGGVLVCEELNFDNHGSFSSPHEPLIDKYHKLVLENSQKLNLEPNTANSLYNLFISKKFNNITINANQPIRISAEEKSLYRLGLQSMTTAILKNNLCSEPELSEMITQLNAVEKNNSIIGGYRNLIVSGQKMI